MAKRKMEIATLPVAPAAATLLELEEEHAALLDTGDLVPDDQRRAYESDLGQSLVQVRAKRDRMGEFIEHCGDMAERSRKAADRLVQRAKFYDNAIERAKAIVMYAITSLGKNEKDEYRRLEGDLHTLRVQGVADKVEILAEEMIPLKYKKAVITLPAENIEDLLKALPEKIAAAVKISYATSLTAIHDDLAANVEVPGADLLINRLSVRVD